MSTFAAIAPMSLNIMGALGLFLFGLKQLSDSLQKISSNNLKLFFDKITKNHLFGITIGAAITSILQSSSAATVLLIGFANAGVIGLTQCISIVFGANIGTTITAQIIAFKASTLALPIIGIGAILFLFSKKPAIKAIGEVLIGLGLMFFGLKVLGGYLKPLADIPEFSALLVRFGAQPLLGVFVGCLITMIIQSSSATTGMIITLAAVGSIDFVSAFALELGSNIGTTITAQIAAIHATKTAKRVAWAHTLFNVIGSGYMLILFYITVDGMPVFLKLIDRITPGDVTQGVNVARHVANAHTGFNVLNAIVLFPFINVIGRVTKWLIRGEDPTISEEASTQIDQTMIHTPGVALIQAEKEANHMLWMTREMTQSVYRVLHHHQERALAQAKLQETYIDKTQARITRFLTNLEMHSMESAQLFKTHQLITLADRIERVADHHMAIIYAFEKMQARQIVFEDSRYKDTLHSITKKIQEMFDLMMQMKHQPSVRIQRDIKDLELAIYQMIKDNRNIGVSPSKKQGASAFEHVMFLYVLTHFERIADQLSKIAKSNMRFS